MPYYDETFVNRTTPQRAIVSHKSSGVMELNIDTVAVMDSVRMTSYRSHAHKDAVGRSKIVEDIQADPYAGFLRSTSERKYREAMEARGYTSPIPAAPGASKKRRTPDRGHAFELTRHTVMTRPKTVIGSDTYRNRYYDGVIPHFRISSRHEAANAVFEGGTDLDPIPYPGSKKDLDAFAQSAYSRVAPTSEVFNAAVFLGELREGLPRLVPSIIQEAARAHRAANRRSQRPTARPVPNRNGNRLAESAGGDYLNVQFGWLPLVSDVRNAATALAKATVQLAQEGQRVHRKYALPTHEDSQLIQIGALPLAGSVGRLHGLVSDELAYGQYGGLSSTTVPMPNGSGSIHKRLMRDRWFEGEFSTFYQLGFDPTSYLDRASALVNLDITPEVLWELAPWSWLVDWNLRLGDSIRANSLASDDKLVMHYGYAMEKTTLRSIHDISHNDGSSKSYSGLGSNTLTAVETTYKRRIRANPYGFRVNTPSAFTGGQLAILGALGLTKL